VLIEAPLGAIERIITRSEPVRELLMNEWIHLFVIGEQGEVTHRYRRGEWSAVQPERVPLAPRAA
jgi:uncharacterized protein YbcC (UPF0753/DUF2309 family)